MGDAWDHIASFRHPRKCKYYLKYSYCKFGNYCKFRDEENWNKNTEKEIANLNSEIEALKIVIEAKEAEIEDKDLELRDFFGDDGNKKREKDDTYEIENTELKEIVSELSDKLKAVKDENESLRN